MGKWGVVWVLELYSSVEGINFRLNGELLIKKIRCEKQISLQFTTQERVTGGIWVLMSKGRLS